jgi:hypothetical protein
MTERCLLSIGSKQTTRRRDRNSELKFSGYQEFALHTAKLKKERGNVYVFYVKINPKTASLGRKARHSPSPAADPELRLSIFGYVLP